MKLNIELDIEIVNRFENDSDAIARIYYPNEGNKIQIIKNLNTIELSDAIFHEIGHLIDWYISDSNQSKNIIIREQNADTIGQSLRYKNSNI